MRTQGFRLIFLIAALSVACSTAAQGQRGESELTQHQQDDTPAEAEAEAPTTSVDEELLRQLDSGDSDERLRAFDTLGELQEVERSRMVELVPSLTKMLHLDADNHPIRLHAQSCDILGEIAGYSPEALDEDARRAVIRGLFIANMKGQSVSRECGLALQKLGGPAVPLLIELFKGDNAEVNALLRKYNQPPNYTFPQNHAKLVAASRLGALRAHRAVELLLDDLATQKTAPEQLSGPHAVSWRVTEGKAVDEQIWALGDIGAPKAADVLIAIVRGEYIQEEWDEITDGLVELQLRQDAAFSLVRLGDREAAGALLEVAENGVVADLERRAAKLEEIDRPMPSLDRYQLNWMMARAYAHLAGADGEEAFVELIEGVENEELAQKYASFLPAIERGAECLAEESPEAQATCFDAMLDASDKEVRAKAAYELSRLPKEAAAPVVSARLGTEHLPVRELLTFAAYRAPSEELIGQIDQLLEEEADRTEAEFDRAHRRLRLLRAWLENQRDEASED